MCDLHYIESELGADVGGMVVFVGHLGTELRAELREVFSYGDIDGWVSGEVGGVVGECAEGEGEFVDVLCLVEHVADEVSAADVVCEVGEELVAEGVVADVLNETATVSVSVGLDDVVIGRVGVTGDEHGADLFFPKKIDDLFMCED